MNKSMTVDRVALANASLQELEILARLATGRLLRLGGRRYQDGDLKTAAACRDILEAWSERRGSKTEVGG